MRGSVFGERRSGGRWQKWRVDAGGFREPQEVFGDSAWLDWRVVVELSTGASHDRGPPGRGRRSRPGARDAHARLRRRVVRAAGTVPLRRLVRLGARLREQLWPGPALLRVRRVRGDGRRTAQVVGPEQLLRRPLVPRVGRRGGAGLWRRAPPHLLRGAAADLPRPRLQRPAQRSTATSTTTPSGAPSHVDFPRRPIRYIVCYENPCCAMRVYVRACSIYDTTRAHINCASCVPGLPTSKAGRAWPRVRVAPSQPRRRASVGAAARRSELLRDLVDVLTDARRHEAHLARELAGAQLLLERRVGQVAGERVKLERGLQLARAVRRHLA